MGHTSKLRKTERTKAPNPRINWLGTPTGDQSKLGMHASRGGHPNSTARKASASRQHDRQTCHHPTSMEGGKNHPLPHMSARTGTEKMSHGAKGPEAYPQIAATLPARGIGKQMRLWDDAPEKWPSLYKRHQCQHHWKTTKGGQKYRPPSTHTHTREPVHKPIKHQSNTPISQATHSQPGEVNSLKTC